MHSHEVWSPNRGSPRMVTKESRNRDMVEDAEVEAETAEPGVGEPGHPHEGADKQRDHPAEQQVAVRHGPAPLLSSARRRRSVPVAWCWRGVSLHHIGLARCREMP